MSRPSASRLGLAIALVLSSPLLAQDATAQDAPGSATTLDRFSENAAYRGADGQAGEP